MTDPNSPSDVQNPLHAVPTADTLPNWIYDVVSTLADWAADHPSLYRRQVVPADLPGYVFPAAGSATYVPVEDCGCAALRLVPLDVLATAQAIRAYRDAQEDGR